MKKNNIAGLTLLELMVVIFISSIVFTLVFTSWDYLNRHVLYHESRGNIRNETSRVADEIALKLRRTPGVLWYTPNSITLLEQDSGDTLEYAFDGKNMTKNGTPIPFMVHGGNITSFFLHDMSTGNLEYLLLEVTITSEDWRNNRDTSRFTVNAKR